MVDSVLGRGVMPDGTRFEFSLDGLATSNQIDKLIKLSAELLKTWDADNKAAQKALDNLSGVLKPNNDNFKTLSKNVKASSDTFDEFDKHSRNLSDTFSLLSRGKFKSSFNEIPSIAISLASGVGTAVGSLVGYADQIKDSLQRGVSGNIFDIAIAAKTAGLSIGEFNKALAESGGSFAALGMGATDGAKQFGVLVGSVRDATKSVGNLGLSNDQLALLTAQQVKIAVAQGFKGKQAQELVTRNARTLGDELDNLANRTGKSVLELAQAASKLGQDPIVANFIRSAQSGGKEISAAAQAFAANLKGVFGDQGEQIAKDALQSAMSGLPMVVTQTGKNLVLASSGIYTEIERQAQAAARGEKQTEADRARLRDMIINEVKARNTELNQYAMMGGSVGESAKQLLAMANEAENYNTAESVKRREQDKIAQQFNASIREMQASFQELLIPVFKLLNNLGLQYTIKVIAGAIGVVADFFEYLGKGIDAVLGFSGAFPAVIGTILGLGAVITGSVAVFKLLQGASTSLVGVFSALYKSVQALIALVNKKVESTFGYPDLDTDPRGKGNRARRRAEEMQRKRERIGKAEEYRKQGYSPAEALERARADQTAADAAAAKSSRSKGMLGKVGKGLGYAALAGGVADVASNAVGRETTTGKTLGVIGSTAQYASLGMMAGPWGAAIGGAFGAALGIWQNFLSNEEDKSAKDELQDQQATASERALKEQMATLEQNRQMLAELRAIREEAGYGNQINARGVSYAASSERKLSNMQFNNA